MPNTKFDSKSFNPEAFGKYVESVPRLKRNEILKSRAVVGSQLLAETFASQTGSHYARIPMFGQATANVVNYDGKTDIEADGSTTFERGVFTLGRAFSKTEKDFSYDITSGVDFLDQVGNQCADIIDEINQDILLSILKGIFSMTGAENLKFVNSHTYDVTANGEGVVEATTLNNAIQQASGQDKDKFTLAIMHSQVATNLENMRLLKYLTYTDANGITRDLAIATWNGRTVIIDDSVPVEHIAASGSGETAVAAHDKYTTYVFGDGVIEKQPLPVKKPFEMSRDPKTNGGEDTLYHRWRDAYGVKGISYEKKKQASLSPTNAELEDGSNWALVNDGESKPKYFDHKAIAIARIISKG